MTNNDPDHLLKQVWLINGFLLLALGTLMLIAMMWAAGSTLLIGGREVVAVPAAGAPKPASARAVRFEPPAAMRGTSTQLVVVYNGRADEAELESSLEYGSRGRGSYGSPSGPMVNVVFVDSGKPQGRLLLDRAAYIHSLRYPGADPGSRDSLQTWISYEISIADTNQDGELDSEDDASLWVSALDGTGFRRVTPDGLHVTQHWMRPDRRSIGIMTLEQPRSDRHASRDEMRQRAFVYDVPTGRLMPFAPLEQPLARAAEILGR
ncbi:MAG TPA: hypothetical protein VJT67_00115 [Longimicrobiaceae bacterium]|nr:hypothetical protein [Longimicrobiaceae bacterium]